MSGPVGAFVAARLRGATQAEAAAEAGISERQARRWEREPDVRNAIAEGAREIARDAERRLRVASTRAADVLVALMERGLPADGVRLRAAQLVLERVDAARDREEIESRIAALEERLGGKP
jgi:hypothetical protein